MFNRTFASYIMPLLKALLPIFFQKKEAVSEWKQRQKKSKKYSKKNRKKISS